MVADVALVHGEPPADGVISLKLRVVQTVDRYRAVVHPNGKPSLTAYKVICNPDAYGKSRHCASPAPVVATDRMMMIVVVMVMVI